MLFGAVCLAVLSVVAADPPLQCFTCLEVVEGEYDSKDQVQECQPHDQWAMNGTLQECKPDHGCGAVRLTTEHAKADTLIESLAKTTTMPHKMHGTFVVRACLQLDYCKERKRLFKHHRKDCTVCDHTACNHSTKSTLALSLFSIVVLPFICTSL